MEFELDLNDCINLDIILEAAKKDSYFNVVVYCTENFKDFEGISGPFDTKTEVAKFHKYRSVLKKRGFIIRIGSGFGISDKGRFFKGFVKEHKEKEIAKKQEIAKNTKRRRTSAPNNKTLKAKHL